MPDEPILSPLRLRLDTSSCPVRIAAAGEIDASNADRFGSQLQEAVAAHREVRIDLSEVSFLESSGLRALLRAGDLASAEGGSLLVAATSRPVQRVLEIMGLTSLLVDASDPGVPSAG